MKKNLLISLFVMLLCVAMLMPAQAAYLTKEDSLPILITEVAAKPSTDQDFGQLAEIYNNTDADMDLYDYEFGITVSRSADLTVQMNSSNFKGGFYAATQHGQVVLKSGELAVIWIVFDASQKTFTEADVRSIMGNIPAGVKIIRVDTTDSSITYGGSQPYIDRSGACYLMANKRGCYAAGGTDVSLAGAYVRIYGQTGQGKSQLYGDIGTQAQTRWQADLTATTASSDKNEACNFGALHSTQTEVFKNVYIPVVETTTATTTANTTSASTTTQSSNTTAPSTGNMVLWAAAAVVACALVSVAFRKRRSF